MPRRRPKHQGYRRQDGRDVGAAYASICDRPNRLVDQPTPPEASPHNPVVQQDTLLGRNKMFLSGHQVSTPEKMVAVQFDLGPATPASKEATITTDAWSGTETTATGSPLMGHRTNEPHSSRFRDHEDAKLSLTHLFCDAVAAGDVCAQLPDYSAHLEKGPTTRALRPLTERITRLPKYYLTDALLNQTKPHIVAATGRNLHAKQAFRLPYPELVIEHYEFTLDSGPEVFSIVHAWEDATDPQIIRTRSMFLTRSRRWQNQAVITTGTVEVNHAKGTYEGNMTGKDGKTRPYITIGVQDEEKALSWRSDQEMIELVMSARLDETRIQEQGLDSLMQLVGNGNYLAQVLICAFNSREITYTHHAPSKTKNQIRRSNGKPPASTITYIHTSATERWLAEPTGTHASPRGHERRGHIRRQRYGVGRQLVREIFVEDTRVNGGSPTAPTIHVRD
jgi:hypothetical protein